MYSTLLVRVLVLLLQLLLSYAYNGYFAIPRIFQYRSVHDADMHAEKHAGTGSKMTIWH